MKKYRISRNNMAYGQMSMQQPSQEEMMMMQQQQAQQQSAPAQQDPQKQIIRLAQRASTDIQKGKSADAVTQELLEGNVPPQAIAQAFEMLVQQGVVDESEMQIVVQVLQSSQSEQQQAQPSEEEMMAMQQQQSAAQEPPMARAGYIKMRQKARAGMSVDQEAAFGSATNLIADKNMQKNDLLRFTQDNVAANQFGQEYDQRYGAGLEQARYGRGKARRQARRDARTADQGDNFAKNNTRRSRQLARRAVNEMPDIYSRADRRALREGLESGEFDKYDVYRGVDVFNPQPQSKPGYPKVDAGSWNSTMIPGRNWGAQTSVEEVTSPVEMVEETSTESNVITDFDNAYDYKNENGVIYTRKKGSSDWTEVDPQSSAGQAIKSRVFGEEEYYVDEEEYYVDEPFNSSRANRSDFVGYDESGDAIFSEDDIVYDEDGTGVRADGQECEQWPGEGSGQTFVEWARSLPYDENGLYTTNCGETYNRTELPGYNRENIEARIPGGKAGYSGAYVEEDPNYVDPNSIRETTMPVYDEDGNVRQFGGQFYNGGQYSSDGLEMARFGRGRARRQARRAERQGRRALNQADRSMRRAFGDIAFPPGVSPMMAGMPMMGPNGAGSNMMQFYGKRGLLGGLREFSMNMPVNFGRGMFFNGMFNPYGMQGGYNDMRYKITYPGQESEVTANADAEKQVEGAVTNQKLEDETKQDVEKEKEKVEEEVAEETAEGTEENGPTKSCGENAFINEAGQCNCNEGYIRNPNIKTFSCISEAELAAMKDDEDPEGTNWVYIALGVGTVGGGIWALRKIAPKVRALISKNPAASKTAKQALLKQIVNQFPNGTQMAAGTKLLGEGVPISQTNITGTKMTEAELRASKQAAQEAASESAEQVEKRIIKESLEGTGTRALPSGTRALPASSSATRRIAAPRALSATEKALLKGQIQKIPGMSTKAIKALAAKHGLSTAGKKGDVARRLVKFSSKLFQVGGSVDPNLYMFTGGGAPDYVDYFADGGYYEDGGYYGDGGFPQYENVYDPYMPMAENGMVANAGQYPMTELDYYKSQQFRDDANASILNNQRAFYPTSTGFSPSGTVGKYSRRPIQNPGPGAQYGGYKEGDVVDMTEAQLGAFLMAGGQVEFVD